MKPGILIRQAIISLVEVIIILLFYTETVGTSELTRQYNGPNTIRRNKE